MRSPAAITLAVTLVAAAAAGALALFRARRGSRAARGALVLANAHLEVHLLRTGAAIQRLIVKRRGRAPLDIVLGLESEAAYQRVKDCLYFGAIVGRCANRIAGGRFQLGGKAYQLATNNGPNALHGGPRGFHVRPFDVRLEPAAGGGGAAVCSYTSADGEEGYPGRLQLTVRYELPSRAPELRISIRATCDAPTIVNIAQHTYFNLAGHAAGDVLGHSLRLAADHFTPTDDSQIPTGEIVPVAGTPLDFTQPHTIGERIQQLPHGYDHNLVLFGQGPQARFITRHQAASSTPRLAATLSEPGSGLTLEVLTTAPGVQLYSGGFLGGSLAEPKGGTPYPRFGGLCLETQNFPDAVNKPSAFPSPVLQPGQTYAHDIVWRFSGL